MSLNGNSSK